MSRERPGPSRWIAYAAVALALIYAAPHTWWMFGVSIGFPGDSSVLDEAFERGWFAVYNVVATTLVLGGAVIVVATEYRWVQGKLLRLAGVVVLVGAVLLLLRGGLGLLTSIPFLLERGPLQPFAPSGSDVVWSALAWEAWFLATGGLYAVVAKRHRERAVWSD